MAKAGQMYFVLHYTIPQDENGGYMHIDDGILFEGFESWSLGRRYDATLPNPIIIKAMPIDGYRGPISDMYDGNICLMSKRLVAELQKCGVDNFDYYPATIRNVETGELKDFFAVNIVGLVSLANLDSAQWSSYDGDALYDTNFDKLVLKSDAALAQPIFRLAENTSTILIREDIKKCLEGENFSSLLFIPPDEWVT